MIERGEKYVHEGSIVADPAASTSSPVLPASILCFLFRDLVGSPPGGGCRNNVIALHGWKNAISLSRSSRIAS